MKQRRLWLWLCVLVALAVLAPIVGCQPQVVEVERVVTAAPIREAIVVEKEVERVVEAAEQPVAAEEIDMAEKLAEREASGASAALALSGRKIIKSGHMGMVVANTDRAMDEAILIAVDSGGYVISAESELVRGMREATLTFGVPVERFEAVQAKMRRLALRVTEDRSSGEDVTDQYVDLQSKLTNLEATTARVRHFLDQAVTVEEALRVNQQLSELEGEIAQVKGRMNYLRDRAAFSTLTVVLTPERPTPTPSPSPTPTPTPTPPGWHPEKTFRAASRTLGALLKAVGNLIIWVVVVVIPVVAPFVLLFWLLRWATRKQRAKRQTEGRQGRRPPLPPAPTAEPPAATKEETPPPDQPTG